MAASRAHFEKPSLGAALRVACPRCGARPITHKFGELVERCPGCDLQFSREEGYWVGALIVNMALVMLVFVVWLGGWILITWPDVPWNVVLYAGLPLMALVPIVFYPQSKTVWLWFDLRTDLDRFGKDAGAV